MFEARVDVDEDAIKKNLARKCQKPTRVLNTEWRQPSMPPADSSINGGVSPSNFNGSPLICSTCHAMASGAASCGFSKVRRSGLSDRTTPLRQAGAFLTG
jgi:hypothetical protein